MLTYPEFPEKNNVPIRIMPRSCDANIKKKEAFLCGGFLLWRSRIAADRGVTAADASQPLYRFRSRLAITVPIDCTICTDRTSRMTHVIITFGSQRW